MTASNRGRDALRPRLSSRAAPPPRFAARHSYREWRAAPVMSHQFDMDTIFEAAVACTPTLVVARHHGRARWAAPAVGCADARRAGPLSSSVPWTITFVEVAQYCRLGILECRRGGRQPWRGCSTASRTTAVAERRCCRRAAASSPATDLSGMPWAIMCFRYTLPVTRFVVVGVRGGEVARWDMGVLPPLSCDGGGGVSVFWPV